MPADPPAPERPDGHWTEALDLLAAWAQSDTKIGPATANAWVREVLGAVPDTGHQAAAEQRGMVVDGDVLRDAIADAVPRMLTDDAARAIAECALDGAVAAGMTVLHGPGLTPRPASASPSGDTEGSDPLQAAVADVLDCWRNGRDLAPALSRLSVVNTGPTRNQETQ